MAGIILGAFPIAIAAIDSYRKVARKVEAWKEIRVVYTRCCEDLKNEQLIFKRHLRMLVLPLVVDDGSAKAFLANPSGKRWKNADVLNLLERKLGEFYELYLSYVQRMEEIFTGLKIEMAFDFDLLPGKTDAQV